MRKLLLLAAFALLVAATPARAQFCPGVSPWVFDDVAASDPFCGFITFMAQNGITLGCQILDANHRLYCPNDNVSRAAMAAFMKRLADIRVEAVDTGPGLLGGPITGIGTISLAPTQLLPTTACAANQVPRWNGTAWTCFTLPAAGTVTSVGSGTGLTGGPITGSGTLSLLPGFQLPQGCTNGQVAQSNGAGGWTCAADANSGGTVTNIATGTGLTGGPITTTGTIAVNTSVIQQRVTGTCPAGSAIASVAANGTVTCTSPPGVATTPWPGTIETTGLAATGATATSPSHLSVVIGTDGLPLIAFYDVTNADLKVLHCDNIACTSGTVTTLDSGGDVGKFNAITLESTGFGAISYYDASNGALKLARCATITCSTATISTIDNTNDVGQYSSIASTVSGSQPPRLVISYYDATNRNLKVAYCNDAACSSPTLFTVESAGDVGKYTSIASGGLRMFISYYDETNSRLRLAICFHNSCASPTLRTLDATPGSGLFTSIAIAQDFTPIVAYARATNVNDFAQGGQVRIAKCAVDAGNSCTTSSNALTGTTIGYVATGTAITVGTDGIPMVAGAINVLLRCSGPDCAFAFDVRSSSFIPSSGNLGTGPAMTIGVDGMPFLAYVSGQLGVLHCGTRTCSGVRAR